MKRTILIASLIASLSTAKSQEDQGMIRYYFGATIDTILRISVDSSIIKLEDSESYVLTCAESDTIVYISLRTYCSKCVTVDSVGDIIYWRGYLAKNTNRYYLLNENKIPIVMSHLDKIFGVVRMIDEEKGYVVRSFRLFEEFEPQVNIETNVRGDKIYNVTYIP